MCWSFEVSIGTWMISTAIAAFLVYRRRKNDLWHAVFLCSFSLVQLIEALMWLDHETTCSNWVWPVVVALPFMVCVGRDADTRSVHGETVCTACFLMTGLASLASDYRDGGGASTVMEGPNGHLVWRPVGRLTKSIIYVSYAYGARVVYDHMRPHGSLFAAIGMASVVVATLFSGEEEFASLWCNIANVYGAAALYFAAPRRNELYQTA